MAFKGLGAIKEHIDKTTSQFNTKWFSLKNDGDEAWVRFLEDPDNIRSAYFHTLKVGERFKSVLCLDNQDGPGDCPLCARGERRSFQAFILVYDCEEKAVKVWRAGTRVVQTFMKLLEEYGDIREFPCKITRSGRGTSTTYQIIVRESSKAQKDYPAPKLEDGEIPNTESLASNYLSSDEILKLAGADEVKPLEDKVGDDDQPF